MITRLSKNVVCIKDIPSNLIEEAFFILKTSYREDDAKDKRKKEIVMSEVDDLIKEYSGKFQKEKEQATSEDIVNKNKLKKIKTRTLLLTVAFVVGCLAVALLFH